MLQIKEYDLSLFDSTQIDKEIITDLKSLENTHQFRFFFSKLNNIINSKSDFSFVKASQDTIKKLKKINTHVNIDKSEIKKYNKNVKHKDYYTLNDLLERIFGYHIEARTQVLKFFLKSVGQNNCIYCLAQYTTSYVGKENKMYVKGNLDHIYPKSLNALVSMSINNLVPVCGHCNQRKLNADLSKFNFNPFDSNEIPVFKFEDVLKINKGQVCFKNLNDLKIENINPTLESRLELTSLYKEYKSPIENLLDRYKKFNSSSYKDAIKEIAGDISTQNLEYFISETPYTDENLQNIPLHKFKNDFYKELESYKDSGKIKFS